MTRAAELVARKQSWADLSDEADEFQQPSESAPSKGRQVAATDGMSVTTGTGSPQMSWADVSDEGELSDFDPKVAGVQEPFSASRRWSGACTGLAVAKAGKNSNYGEWQSPSGQQTPQHQRWQVNGRSQRRNSNNRVGRNMPQSPQQQRHQNSYPRQPQSPQTPQTPHHFAGQRPFAGSTDNMNMSWTGPSFPPSPTSAAQPFSIQVEGMPTQLCNECCLDAILHQAGLQDFVLSCETSHGAKVGVATIKLANWHAATQCYNHFSKQSWNLGKTVQVKMAPISDGQQSPKQRPQQSSPPQQQGQQQAPLDQQEQQQDRSPPSPLMTPIHTPPRSPQVTSQPSPTQMVAMDCGMYFQQASPSNGSCQSPTVAWVPAPFVGEVCDFAPTPFFIAQSPQQMALAGVQMAHA